MLRAVIPIEAATPLHLQRCVPEAHCPQAERCARRDALLCDHRNPIDGTALRVGAFCPLFVDARGVALEVA